MGACESRSGMTEEVVFSTFLLLSQVQMHIQNYIKKHQVVLSLSTIPFPLIVEIFDFALFKHTEFILYV